MFDDLADLALYHLAGQGRFGNWNALIKYFVDGSENLRHTHIGETLGSRAMASETGAAG